MNFKTVLSIDLETYSSVDLQDSGVYAYAESEDFQILLLAYAWDNYPVQVIDMSESKQLPKELESALLSDFFLKTAFNANFERVCLAKYLGRTLPPEQWSCTSVMARELGLPGDLKGCGNALHFDEDKQKLKTGSALINFFCKPCTPTKSNGYRTRNLPYHNEEKWEDFKVYNIRDVETEREIRKILERFPTKDSEQALWVIDQKINDRGVQVDLDLAEKASFFDKSMKQKLKEEAFYLTGLSNPNSTPQVKTWIEEQTGIAVKSLNKADIPELREQIQDENVLRLLDVRAGLSKTSLEKYDAMLRVACSDGRVRGVTQFYGASRTGRWAGRLIQMQNLPQNKMSEDALDSARAILKQGNYRGLEMVFDDVPDTLSQLIRTAFIPKEGHRFIVADFSAIEARVLAWIASEQWRLEVFATHGKIYEASAEQMFHLPKGSVKKGDPMRQKGKVSELALGYGGSVGALISMGALKMGLEEAELKPLVDSWRRANPKITQFWWDTGNEAKNAVEEKVITSLPYGIKFYMAGPFLKCRLPSGRDLSYAYPQIQRNELTYMHAEKKQWVRTGTYGPKLVENIIQAIARDCLAETMIKLDSLGIPVVFHVHDEVICELPEGVGTVKEICDIMSQPISWAPNLLLNAEGYECTYYKKD